MLGRQFAGPPVLVLVAAAPADVVLLEKSLDVLAEGIIVGRKTFANITKYILNTVSANFGNMATLAASSMFLRSLPLLPSQILLTNFLSDLPLVAIATDRVDPELIARPRHWDLRLIARFMVLFGLLSATFDLALIGGLLLGFRADTALVRTAWFIESACSEILVTFAIRTRGSFLRSRPSHLLLAVFGASVGLVLLLPFTAAGRALFNFTTVPAEIAGFVALVLATYFAATELVKRPFFRRMGL